MPKAAVCPAINEALEVVDVGLDDPKAGEVRVRMGASGVCHSDLSVVNGTLLSPLPAVLGHEGAGIVEAVGEGVTRVKPGDHVVLSFVPQCGTCYMCTHDSPEMCETGFIAMALGAQLDMTPRFTRDGAPLHQMSALGTFSEELVCPEISVVKIDADVPFTSAALIGCGVLTGFGAAANTADIAKGDTVAVIGCGGVGLNAIQGAKWKGAERIIAVDRFDSKLDMAKQFGATDLVNASNGDPGRAGAGAHRRARRRRVVRGHRAQGHGAAGVRDGAPRRPGDHRRRSEDGTDDGDPDRDGAARQREAGAGLVVRILRRAARRAPSRRPLQGRHAQARRARLRAGSASRASTTRSRRWKRARSPDRSSTTGSN